MFTQSDHIPYSVILGTADESKSSKLVHFRSRVCDAFQEVDENFGLTAYRFTFRPGLLVPSRPLSLLLLDDIARLLPKLLVPLLLVQSRAKIRT